MSSPSSTPIPAVKHPPSPAIPNETVGRICIVQGGSGCCRALDSVIVIIVIETHGGVDRAAAADILCCL